MAQWRTASRALANQRAAELRALTPARALEAADALLSLPVPLAVHRWRYSGLVDQQALFRRSRG
jgi:hypothetical protein